jgi:Beta-lactamase superfamily domain
MFGTTFLGHQGWLFQSDAACFLVDPLLCEDFGHQHALGYRVFPPRVWTVDKLPKLDAVVLSHEHDDHFDIPSLAKLDRAIPIYLSVRSSSAARGILETMGFTVHALVPGEPRVFGDLELIPFTGDHVSVNCRDEWDALPFMVRHKDGSFFSMVDIPILPSHVEWAKQHAPKPGLVSWTNNSLDWSHMAGYLRERTEATQQTLMKMGVGHKLIAEKWGVPAAMMTCAGGFSFTGEREWLNSRVFCVDTEAVCNFMSTMYKKEKFYSAVPGQTFWLEGNKLKKVEPRTPFLATEPVEAWPSRVKMPRKQFPDYEPATGRRELAPGELDEIAAGLREFARTLVGGATFRSLYSLLAIDAAGKKPTFAFALRDGTRTHVFEYAPSECDFRPGDDPQSCLAGLECWAADMLAIVRAEIGPIALLFGRARLWNAASARFKFDIFDELHRISHPLVRPAEVLGVYQALWKKAAETVAVFARK